MGRALEVVVPSNWGASGRVVVPSESGAFHFEDALEAPGVGVQGLEVLLLDQARAVGEASSSRLLGAAAGAEGPAGHEHRQGGGEEPPA